MFEPFKAAPQRAQIYHVFLLLFVFLSWVSTMVTFGSPLMQFSYTEPLLNLKAANLKVWWNKVSVEELNTIVQVPQDRSVSHWLGNGCSSGGDATLAFAVFAFLLGLAHVYLLFARIAGFGAVGVRDSHHSITAEMLLAMGTWFCFFIQVCVFGGACYTKARETKSFSNVEATGFGFMLACFFFLLLTIVGYVRIRQNYDLALGNGINKAGSASYTEPELGGPSHHEDDAGNYSYQGSAAL